MKTRTFYTLCIILFGFFLIPNNSQGQSKKQLHIDSCFSMAKRNFPLIRQLGLLEQSKQLSLANVDKTLLPQLSINASATYQSEVTKLPIQVPNMEVPVLDKDQYKAYAELSQSLSDLFLAKDQKNLLATHKAIESQQVEVQLYQLREQVNQLFFNAMLIDAQLAQSKLMQADIQHGMQQVEAAIKNGTSTKSNLNKLQAEYLKVQQKDIELLSNKQAFVHMLAHLIGEPIAQDCQFTAPELLQLSQTLNRPELKLYELQQSAMDMQEQVLQNKNKPRFNAFIQGGVGQPALNMLNPDMRGFYLTGIRLNWNLAPLYTYKNEKKLLELNKGLIAQQQETFVFNNELSLMQQQEDARKYQNLLSSDAEIINLRESVKKASAAQLRNGIISSYDYMNAVSEEDQARQNLIVHKIKWLQSQYKQQATRGN